MVLRRPPAPSGRGLAFSREQLQQHEKSEGDLGSGRVRERIVNEVETESTERVSEYMKRVPQYACFDVVLIHSGRGIIGLCSRGDTATTRRIVASHAVRIHFKCEFVLNGDAVHVLICTPLS